ESIGGPGISRVRCGWPSVPVPGAERERGAAGRGERRGGDGAGGWAAGAGGVAGGAGGAARRGGDLVGGRGTGADPGERAGGGAEEAHAEGAAVVGGAAADDGAERDEQVQPGVHVLLRVRGGPGGGCGGGVDAALPGRGDGAAERGLHVPGGGGESDREPDL